MNVDLLEEQKAIQTVSILKSFLSARKGNKKLTLITDREKSNITTELDRQFIKIKNHHRIPTISESCFGGLPVVSNWDTGIRVQELHVATADREVWWEVVQAIWAEAGG